MNEMLEAVLFDFSTKNIIFFTSEIHKCRNICNILNNLVLYLYLHMTVFTNKILPHYRDSFEFWHGQKDPNMTEIYLFIFLVLILKFK